MFCFILQAPFYFCPSQWLRKEKCLTKCKEHEKKKKLVLKFRHGIFKLHESGMNVQEFANHLALYQSAVAGTSGRAV